MIRLKPYDAAASFRRMSKEYQSIRSEFDKILSEGPSQSAAGEIARARQDLVAAIAELDPRDRKAFTDHTTRVMSAIGAERARLDAYVRICDELANRVDAHLRLERPIPNLIPH